MLVKTTKKEILEHIVKQDIKITDNSICGRCSKCGECCTNLLPITQTEINEIQKYVTKNNIHPQLQLLVMENRLTCPYYDGKKCLIYEIRPLICKIFYCYKKPTVEDGKNLVKEQRIIVDMWKVAREIEEKNKRNNHETA